ncbi:MAG TPA: 1-acyl-sn-glycerol-3-phosphate acyltransferase [Rhodanobacteraceae bacterium]|nr:1-acyl-sn-glycerol-3-phosphate acyltransferase [Rhodanobacteraceae bacterium]
MSARVPPLPAPGDLPPHMPHARDNAFRRLCRAVVRRAGWQLAGTFPDCPRLVVIVAPHSSWWDGIWGLLFKVGMGANVTFIAKKEVFAGPLGWLLRRLGGLPVDRSAPGGVVKQLAARFARGEGLWLAITPEGTRKHVQRWKSGYWHIARGAGVPVLPVYIDYPSRSIGVGPLGQPAADVEEDLQRMRDFYAPWQGKHRGVG